MIKIDILLFMDLLFCMVVLPEFVADSLIGAIV